MAKKPSVTTVSSGFASNTQLNANFTALRDAFDNTLSLDGSSPNAMGADLDLNNNDLLNASVVNTATLKIGGVNVVPSAATALAIKKEFNTVSALLADTGTYSSYAENDYLRVVDGGFTYRVAASSASDHHVITAGGVKLYTQHGNGVVQPQQFGAIGNGVADDTEPMYKAFLRAQTLLLPVDLCGLTYKVTKTNYFPLFDGLFLNGNGAKIIIDSTAVVSDTTGSFLRYSNWLFYKSTSTPITVGVKAQNLHIEDNRGYTNAFGGVTCSNASSNTAEIEIAYCKYTGFGTLAADTDTKAGALWQGRGYDLRIHDNVAIDTGYAVFAPGSKATKIYNNRFSFCGVSRDFAKWSNLAAITTWDSLDDDIHDNTVYVTGGTSMMLGIETNIVKQRLRCVGNTVIGAGLSAIDGNIRPTATSGVRVIDAIVTGNIVQGFLCCVASTAHSGISIGIQSSVGTYDSILSGGNLVDYLAPWETFDSGTQAVTGSYNTNKAVGNDVGYLTGADFNSVPVGGVKRLDGVGDVVLNVQKIACRLSGIVSVNYDLASKNCGWSKQVGGAPHASQVLSGLDILSNTQAVVRYRAEDHAVGVTANNALASLVRVTNNTDITLSCVFRGATSQQYMLRIANSNPNLKLTVLEMDPGPMFISDGGHIRYVDTSGGATALSTEIRWLARPASPEIITGSRQIPISSELLIKTNTVGRAETLPPAKSMTGKTVRFVNRGASADITVTPDGTETINGSSSAVTITPGSTLSLVSTGTEWFSV